MSKIMHHKDIEYFEKHPAPLMELMHSAHFTNINSTITFYGPMLYFLVRAFCCEQILEIGHAEGYSSWYLANGVKDNAVRFKMDGNRYYGVDIIQTEKVRNDLKDLPATIINMDSINITKDTFQGITFDMIFQDGAHDREHVLHEIKTLYPQLKGGGEGYLIFHDCYGPSEDSFMDVVNDPDYKWEWVRLFSVYGIAILRKMDGYDYDKRYWV